MPFISEDDIERFAIQIFSDVGYSYLHGSRLSPEAAPLERPSQRAVTLAETLRRAVTRLNADVQGTAVDGIVRKVEARASGDIANANRDFHKLLVEGVPFVYNDDEGRERHDRARLIDFDNADANEWLVVNQLSVQDDAGERRPDLIVYVNGLPLGLLEFKNPADPKATIRSAFRQIQTYKDEITNLLAFNEILVATDGTKAKVGSLTAEWERFNVWKDETGKVTASQLEFVIRDLFAKPRLLDMVRYFTLFAAIGPIPTKIQASYHQLHGVNKAIQRTCESVAPEGDRRAGVFWHTQGSGKSYSMVFFVGKAAQEPALANPTFVVMTDRNDLDGQIFDQFAACKEFLRQEPEQADDRTDLRQRLDVASGHIIFTTIQKFYPDEGEIRYKPVTKRSNVIVMADEAHRSQYGFGAKTDTETGETRYGFARHLRDALPHATFIGFTGTPIEKTDHNTRALFGNYIDIYDVKRAVDDGATVPIFYEARVSKLDLPDEQKPHLDETFEELTEGQEQDEKARHASRWSQLEVLVGAQPRLDAIAADLVEHLEKRRAASDFGGKALVVCMGRQVCSALYEAILRRRPDWGSTDDATGRMKVVITGSAADVKILQPHIRSKQGRKAIEKRFKDPGDDLMLVLVRDMWLTGFDVPSLHTIYVDKPMKGHTLMQAVTRVNRVFRTKPGGLVVDYLGIAHELRKALKTYVESGGKGEPILDEDKAEMGLQREYEIVRDIFHGFPYHRYLDSDTDTKLRGLIAGADFIVGLPTGTTARYLSATENLRIAFTLAAASDVAASLADEVAFFRAVRATILKATTGDGEDSYDVDLALQQLVSEALSSHGIIEVTGPDGLGRTDIAVFSDEFLAGLQVRQERNLARQMLEKLLRGEILQRARKNTVAARRFSDMLAEALAKYEDRATSSAELLEALVRIAKEVRDDPARASRIGLSSDELPYYDALTSIVTTNEPADQARLRTLAREINSTVHGSGSLDWHLSDNAKAKVRVQLRRLLRRYAYLNADLENVVQLVMEQAEVTAREGS